MNCKRSNPSTSAGRSLLFVFALSTGSGIALSTDDGVASPGGAVSPRAGSSIFELPLPSGLGKRGEGAQTPSPGLVAADTTRATQVAEARGTVQSLDDKAGQVKIAHEPVKSLGWPAMTMDFEVADRGMLGQLYPGQQIVFTFVQRGNRYVITSIRPPSYDPPG